MCTRIAAFEVPYSSCALIGNRIVLSRNSCSATRSASAKNTEADTVLGGRFLTAFAAVLAGRSSLSLDVASLMARNASSRRFIELKRVLEWLRHTQSDAVTVRSVLLKTLQIPGRSMRDSPLWIGAHNPKHDGAFVFCEPALIEEQLQELEAVSADDACVNVARAAWIAYAHICAVHPLNDGNGRLARCLMVSVAYRLCRSWNLACMFAVHCFSRMGNRVENFALLGGAAQEEIFSEVNGVWAYVVDRLKEIVAKAAEPSDAGRTVVAIHRRLRDSGVVDVSALCSSLGVSAGLLEDVSEKVFLHKIKLGKEYIDAGIF